MTRTCSGFAVALAVLATCAFGAADTAQYGFEKSTQGWAIDGSKGSVSRSTAMHFAGGASLALKIHGKDANRVAVMNPSIPAGRRVTFHVWVPAHGITSVQPFVQQPKTYKWLGAWTAMSNLKGNAWNTIVLTVPKGWAPPEFALGMEATGDGTSSPTVYLDSVTW
jgi:hypothetical protein